MTALVEKRKNNLNTLFDDIWGSGAFWNVPEPRQYNIQGEYLERDGNTFKLQLSAVGLNKDDISISVENNILTIESNVDVTDKSPLVKNIHWKKRISNTYDAENISAKLENGLLTVHMKQNEQEVTNSKRIEIE